MMFHYGGITYKETVNQRHVQNFTTAARIFFVIERICWFVCLSVGLFVRDALMLVLHFSNSRSPIFMKFDVDVQHLCQISLSVFRGQVSVKVQGQNRRTKNLPNVTAILTKFGNQTDVILA